MMYSSLNFVIFLMMVLILYYLIPVKIRPVFIVLVNCIFCSFFGISHCLFLLGSTLFIGILVRALLKRRSKLLMSTGIILIAGSLFLVKFGSVFGFDSLFVPLGYSFYGLQLISFVVDAYRNKFDAFNWIDYLEYMTFFPLLLQGPITRFNEMKEEFHKEVQFDFQQVKQGLLLVFFGMFKKLVIADRLALFTLNVFNEYLEKSGGVLLTAGLFYGIQLYADFSGCTDISRGAAECLGIGLPVNFNAPYYSSSVKGFWNRWHISLSSWLKDYIYIPLGGNRKGTVRKYIHLIFTFLVSALWHGTGIQYIAWGLMQAFGQIFESFVDKTRFGRLNTKLKELMGTFCTFVFTVFSWIIFRAHGLRAGCYMILYGVSHCLDYSGLLMCGLDEKDFILSFVLIIVLMSIDYLRIRILSLRQKICALPGVLQYGIWMILIFSILIFGIYGSGYNASDFIYMQF